MLIIKGLAGALFQVVLFGALLLIPAPTWFWQRAILFLVTYGIVISVAIVLLAIFAPASLEARLEPPASKSQPMADRVVTIVMTLAMLAWFIFIPIDVFYVQMFPPPSLALSIIGAVIGLAGLGIVLIAIYQNSFAVPIVRDQSDRNQVLVDTGLYGLVRHPFYTGVLLLFAGIALWLESYASVLTLSVVLATLITRIIVEEKTLCQNLPGYIEFTKKVRYRLVPWIW